MKAIIKTQKELNKVRKHQGFSRIVRAFMAIGEDPKMANISASFIQKESTNSSSTNKSSPKNATGDPTSSIAASIQPLPTNALIKNTSDDFSFGFLSGEPDLTTTQLREDFDKLQHNYQNLLQTLVTTKNTQECYKTSFTCYNCGEPGHLAPNLFVLNDVYANLHFEAFDFFSNEYSQTMRVDNESGFSHSQLSLM